MIKSKENQIYKLCKKLQSKKYRDRFGKYLLEGEKLITDAFSAKQRVETLVIAEGENYSMDFPDCNVVTMDQRLFSDIAQTETSQGIIAIADKPQVEIADFLEQIQIGQGNVVILDRLQDPGNIGTIIRTADGAGYSGIITIASTGDVFSPKIVRSAAGSLFRIPILTEITTKDTIELLKKANKTIIATCFDTDINYYEVPLDKDIGLVIGNEGSGISEEFIKNADVKIEIPMEGNINSLNASVAAGILMYESMRKKIKVKEVK